MKYNGNILDTRRHPKLEIKDVRYSYLKGKEKTKLL